MKNIKNLFFGMALFALVMTNYSCQQAGGNTTGSEFIPGMAHSVAYEANVYTYYSLNTWNEESTIDLKTLSNPRIPVAGTIARGQSSTATSDQNFASATEAVEHTMKVAGSSDNTIPMMPNGSAKYYYADTDEDRLRATDELIYNPYPITAAGLEKGKLLYDINCGVCHGEKGDGNGWLVDEKNPNAVYPAQPADFLNGEFPTASNGRYYHAIVYGKNVMGGYTDKLSYEERWQVIHWIRALQAKAAGGTYSEDESSLNPDFGVPASTINILASNDDDSEEMEGDHSSDEEADGHSEGH